ncbi:hypothetical protein SDC9_206690 [bioreactor metagenome]|uniref:Uncharacterized protein n=1 Tax=bioreactor metagenome TaxID=1076179 RepID=A0A645JHA5_9ZZZZ
MAAHALSRTYISFSKVCRRFFYSFIYMLLFYGPQLNIIQIAVVALAYHRINGLYFHIFLFAFFYHIIHNCIMDEAHIQCIGQSYDGLKASQFINLYKS